MEEGHRWLSGWLRCRESGLFCIQPVASNQCSIPLFKVTLLFLPAELPSPNSLLPPLMSLFIIYFFVFFFGEIAFVPDHLLTSGCIGQTLFETQVSMTTPGYATARSLC